MDQTPAIPDLTLLRLIGTGSYGDVWIARTLTGVYRAVKIVDRARFSDDRPFQRELEGISRFQRAVGDQPRQLALLHVGRLEPQGLLYYVMELADDVEAGTDIDPERYEPLTLKSLRAKRPVLPAAEVVRLGVELTRALAGLHAVGLIHRDVKPSNIILVNGVPKLADIGLVTSREVSVTSLGTPGYSPPEGAGSLSADLWGIGRVLYELVTGLGTKEFPRLPPDFDHRADAAVLLELNEVVLRACEPEPQDRYPTAQAMLDELLLVQAGRSVKDLNRMRERLRTLARVARVAAVIGLAVIIGLGVKNYFTLRELAREETAARAAAEENERFARYTANLHVAQLAYNSGDFGLARSALRRDVPATGQHDMRGVEWRALWNETGGNAVRQFGTVGDEPIVRVAYAANGQLAATLVGAAGRVLLWDLAAGTSRELTTGIERLGGFTADAAQLVVLSASEGVRLLNLATGQIGPSQITGVQLLSYVTDGRRLLLRRKTDNEDRLFLWDVISQTETAAWNAAAAFPGQELRRARVSIDGRLLGVEYLQTLGAGQQTEYAVWDFQTQAFRFRRINLGEATAGDFSPDGSSFALALMNGPVVLLDANDGRTQQSLAGATGYVFDLDFSLDGRLLFAGGVDQVVRVWDVETGALVDTLRGHEGVVGGIFQNAVRGLVMTTASDGTIREWQVPSPPRTVARGGYWSRLLDDPVMAPDGTFLAATLADGRLTRVDVATLAPIGEPWTSAFVALGFAGEGLRALTRDRMLVIVDPGSGAVQPTNLRIEGPAVLSVVAASANADVIMLGQDDGTVTLWDGATRRAIVSEQRHASSIMSVAMAGNARWAASADSQGHVWLWRPAEGRAEKELPLEPTMARTMAFSADGRWLAIFRGDGMMTVFDPDTLAVAARSSAHTYGAGAAVFAADGSRLISAGFDGLVFIWSVPDFRRLGALSFEPGVPSGIRAICALSLSANQQDLIATTEDGRLRRWNLRP